MGLLRPGARPRRVVFKLLMHSVRRAAASRSWLIARLTSRGQPNDCSEWSCVGRFANNDTSLHHRSHGVQLVPSARPSALPAGTGLGGAYGCLGADTGTR